MMTLDDINTDISPLAKSIGLWMVKYSMNGLRYADTRATR